MAFSVGPYSFVFWRGSPPQLSGERVLSHTRPGVDGIGHTRIGSAGNEFECELEAWFGGSTLAANFLNAKRAMADYQALRNAGLLRVIFEDVDYVFQFRTWYAVTHVEEITTQSAIRLLGPSVDYASGAKVVARFRMTPHFI